MFLDEVGELPAGDPDRAFACASRTSIRTRWAGPRPLPTDVSRYRRRHQSGPAGSPSPLAHIRADLVLQAERFPDRSSLRFGIGKKTFTMLLEYFVKRYAYNSRQADQQNQTGILWSFARHNPVAGQHPRTPEYYPSDLVILVQRGDFLDRWRAWLDDARFNLPQPELVAAPSYRRPSRTRQKENHRGPPLRRLRRKSRLDQMGAAANLAFHAHPGFKESNQIEKIRNTNTHPNRSRVSTG